MTVTLAGCATSGDFPAPPPPPELPEIPSKLEQDCRDPGVPASIKTAPAALAVLADTRLYAACNRRQHRGMKAFYRNVQKGFGGEKT